MQSVTMAISLTIKGPLLTQSSSPGDLGLDSVIARHNNNTPYIPGTLITGNLRQALEELLSIEASYDIPLSDWLGETSSNNTPKNKRLYISDFDLDKQDQIKLSHDNIRNRITVNSETGAVEDQHILMLENPFLSGEEYTFTGNIHFFSPKAGVENVLSKIKTGLNWLSQLGSLKSIGFGQIVNIQFINEERKDIPQANQFNPIEAKNGDTLGLIVKPRYPICLSTNSRKDGNTFESEAIISGGAIIGSIATTWNHLLGKTSNLITDDLDPERKLLCENFSKLRITHAFPTALTQTQKRPVVAPLSLCKIESDEHNYYDVAKLSSPCLIEINGQKEAPDFALDWKKHNAPQHAYPWPYLRFNDWGWEKVSSDLRVRTKINPENKRSSENALFAYEQILPNHEKGNAFAWCARVDLSRIAEEHRSEVNQQLQSLLTEGLIALSKTNTPADIEFLPDLPAIYSSQVNNKYWIITLQTDALLGTPENLDYKSAKNELESMYQTVWSELLGDKVKLRGFFARQKLSGGEYRKNVFQKTALYRPWLLTEAGSVFILEASENAKKEDIERQLQIYLDQGLPLTSNTLEYYQISAQESKQWQDCPYIAQNGYAEIAININMPKNVISLNDSDKQVKPIMQEEA